MIRRTFTLLLLGTLAGCEASARLDPNGAQTKTTEQTRLAAYAASPDNQYPQKADASDDLRAAAIVNREDGTVKVYNFTDQPLTNAKVWINGTHVYEVDSIGPHSSVTLRRTQFFDNRGNSLSSSQTPVSKVELQRGDELFELQGPVFE